jgi:GTP:adenosylcobinamide-phosphate guanylyltransferase
MDAFISAGGIPKPGDTLYEHTKGKSKALLDIGGRPMIQWVLDALSGAIDIDRVVIVGLDEGTGLTCIKPFTYVPDAGGILDNARAAALKILELNPSAKYILGVSCDIPAITAKMVDWVTQVTKGTESEAYLFVVAKEVMEARFPDSNRSFYKLKDVAVCGCDMHIASARLITQKEGLWDKIADARKNAFKQAQLIGLDTLIYFLLRRKTLEETAIQISKRLGINGSVHLNPYAETGMDVDKSHQLEILRAELS